MKQTKTMKRGTNEMWYKEIDKIGFLLELYNDIPDLNDVQINKIEILEEGDKVTITFNMPRFADHVPEKWKKSKFDVVEIECDFIVISKFHIDFNNINFRSNMWIERDNSDKLIIKIEGDINCSFIAEYAMIQRVRGNLLDE